MYGIPKEMSGWFYNTSIFLYIFLALVILSYENLNDLSTVKEVFCELVNRNWVIWEKDFFCKKNPG